MGGVSGREVQEGGDMCVHIADSLLCTMESIVQHCNAIILLGGKICSPLHHSIFLIMLVLIYMAHSK